MLSISRLIFEGADGKASVSALTHYILGVAERSEEEFREIIENTDLEIIPDVMSTLEQILTRGRKEGMEKGMGKGMYKKSIFNLLKLAVRFPDLPAEELSDLAELKLKVVESILEVAAGGDNDTLLKYLKEELLADVPLDAAEEEKLAQLSEELVRKKK